MKLPNFVVCNERNLDIKFYNTDTYFDLKQPEEPP